MDGRSPGRAGAGLETELLQDWCSSVFMYCDVIDRGGPEGLGLTMRLHVKGFKPHSLFIVVQIVDVVLHHSIRSPSVATSSVRVLHRLFVRNHTWAMDRACQLLVAQVHRRRAPSGQITPPRATFPHNLAIYRSWQERRAAATRWR